MRNRIIGSLVALTLSVPAGAALTTTTADAAPKLHYANCTKLNRDYPHGVSKSRKAAMKQVRQGYGRPAFGKIAQKVYRENKSRLDRDKDGTACER